MASKIAPKPEAKKEEPKKAALQVVKKPEPKEPAKTAEVKKTEVNETPPAPG